MRVDVIGRDQEARRQRQAGGADAEGHRIDVGDVDAGELGAESLLGDRAHGLAEIGRGEQEPKRSAAISTTRKPTTRGTDRKATPRSTTSNA